MCFESTIAPFAPLIQLFGGIYLLLTYETFISTYPLGQQLEKIKEGLKILKDIKLGFQGFVTPEQSDDVDKHIVDIEHTDTKWIKYQDLLREVFLVYFLYSVVILFYIGIENWLFTHKLDQIFLMITNLFFILYILCLTTNIIDTDKYFVSYLKALGLWAFCYTLVIVVSSLSYIYFFEHDVLNCWCGACNLLPVLICCSGWLIPLVYIVKVKIDNNKIVQKLKKYSVVLSDLVDLIPSTEINFTVYGKFMFDNQTSTLEDFFNSDDFKKETEKHQKDLEIFKYNIKEVLDKFLHEK